MMDDHGYVSIVGRCKDIIIRGGENISPSEIEFFLGTHPSIEEVHVFGVPDILLGEKVVAWIRLKAGSTTSAPELNAYCKGKIAHFKIPAIFKFVDSFPMTVTGKVMKYKMRDEYTKL
jgi:fatty-acyl-CoA synthase